MDDLKSKERFSNRVDDYRRYRPSYPKELMAWLRGLVTPRDDAPVADVGSGTGIFTRQLLEAGYRVLAVEPNAAMRSVAEEDLRPHSGFTSVAADAEATTLATASVAMVTAAQAFHWFDPVRARGEFQRILRPGGYVVLIWNDRDEVTPFGREYEAVLRRYAADRRAMEHRTLGDEKQQLFWGDVKVEQQSFPNAQRLSRAGLHGRTSSSSYAPKEGQRGHDDLHRDLDLLFDKHEQAGEVEMVYTCRVFAGLLGAA